MNVVQKIINRAVLLNLFSLSEKIKIVLWQMKILPEKKIKTQIKREYEVLIALLNLKAKVVQGKGFVRVSFPLKNGNIEAVLNLNSSDLLVFNQIMINEEYKPVVDIFKNKGLSLNTFIDAGANIGLTSLYLKHFYPQASGVALEPFPATYERLKRNLAVNNSQQMDLLMKGLWSKTTPLKGDDSFRDGLDWAFRLMESSPEEATIEAVSVTELIQSKGLETVDFFKIDIEGGEEELFKDGADISWLKKVKVLAVEIHDELGIRDRIENLLRENGFDLSHAGELTIAVRLT